MALPLLGGVVKLAKECKPTKTNSELEEFWLFSICVAGKESALQKERVRAFLDSIPFCGSPFKKVSAAIADGSLDMHLRKCKLGRYERTSKAFQQSIGLKLETSTLDDLEDVYGVGPKTSRFFLLHTRHDVRVAVLDTHILKRLRETYPDAPKATPQSRREYRKWEKHALELADKDGLSPFEFDKVNWTRFAVSTRAQNEGN